MTFISEFHPKTRAFVRKLDEITKKRILQKINELEVDPFPHECIKISIKLPGFENEKVFRVRVGNYRILYTVEKNPDRLIVARIDKRGVVYE
jgi:mRNA interferase RelE/StbE